jgi:hypothetical protein
VEVVNWERLAKEVEVALDFDGHQDCGSWIGGC